MGYIEVSRGGWGWRLAGIRAVIFAVGLAVGAADADPVGSVTGSPAPIAAAIGSSIR